MKQDDGAISLAAALLVPVLLLFLGQLYGIAVRAKTDWDLARLAAAGAEAELSDYDRPLYDTFGLFGAPMNGSAATEATAAMLPFPASSTVVRGREPLFDPAVLKGDIVRHMKVRAPFQMLAGVLQRHARGLPSFSLIGEHVFESQIRDLTSEYDVTAPLDRIAADIDLPDDEQRSALEALIDREITSLYEDIVTDLMPSNLYDPGTNAPADLFNPEHLSGLGAAVDKLFAVGDYGVFERLYLAEYALSYFHHATPLLYVQLRQVELKTPDGRSLGTLPEARRFEVEQMLFGGTPVEAKNRTAGAIRAVRTIILLANNFSDTTKHGRYRTKAAIVSGTIAVLSLGSVVIPPETLTYLFMLSDAVSDAKKETAALLRGQGVRVWPRTGLELYYPDYLRMLLLVQPMERLTARIGTRIAAVCPGHFYTALEISVRRADRSVTLPGAYRTSADDAE